MIPGVDDGALLVWPGRNRRVRKNPAPSPVAERISTHVALIALLMIRAIRSFGLDNPMSRVRES
jgi:hypothetical protein